MTTPVRIQLSRRPGFRLQEVSRALNGLDAVKVDRTTKWGNRYKIGALRRADDVIVKVRDAAHATLLHRRWTKHWYGRYPQDIAPLRGKNVACWCHLCPAHAAGKMLGVECPDCAPCHGDTLLEIANR